MNWDILLALPAALVLFAVTETSVRVVTELRRRDFMRHEDKTSAEHRASIALPEDRSDGWPKGVQPIVERFRIAHQRAVDAQNAYHAAVVRSATCLALTFCAMAISTTHFYDNHRLHVAIVWLEVLALAFVLYNWWTGKQANRAWVAQRIQAELLRQDQFIGLLMPDLSSPSPHGEVGVKRAAIDRYDSLDVVEAINAYWMARRAAMESSEINGSDFSRTAFLRYLHKRPLRQLGWFSDSIGRLEQNAHGRDLRLRILFAAALFVAVVKLLLTLHASADPLHQPAGLFARLEAFVSPCLLIITGWSATEAAYYLNQNARSLVHRYRNQLARMRQWFSQAKAELPLDSLLTADLDQQHKRTARALALDFEDLMIEELIDWIYIAKLDTLEIAP